MYEVQNTDMQQCYKMWSDNRLKKFMQQMTTVSVSRWQWHSWL